MRSGSACAWTRGRCRRWSGASRAGLVERRRESADERRVTVHLTEVGRASRSRARRVPSPWPVASPTNMAANQALHRQLTELARQDRDRAGPVRSAPAPRRPPRDREVSDPTAAPSLRLTGRPALRRLGGGSSRPSALRSRRNRSIRAAQDCSSRRLRNSGSSSGANGPDRGEGPPDPTGPAAPGVLAVAGAHSGRPPSTQKNGPSRGNRLTNIQTPFGRVRMCSPGALRTSIRT